MAKEIRHINDYFFEDAVARELIKKEEQNRKDEIYNLDTKINQLSNFVTPEMFGAVGDGVTDDTTAFKQACESGCNILLQNKTYIISDVLEPTSNSVIDLNGATINCEAEEPFSVFFIEDKENITIKNGCIDGLMKDGSESGHFIITISSSQNITIENMELKNQESDAIYIGYNFYYTGEDKFVTKNIRVNNCYIHNVGRNGISLVSGDDVYITNCVFEYINKNLPKAGIDIEPETGSEHHLHINNIRIHNNTFRRCDGAGIGLIEGYEADYGYLNISNNTFDNCSFSYYRGTSAPSTTGFNYVFENCEFVNQLNSQFAIQITNPLKGFKKIYKNVVLNGTGNKNHTGATALPPVLFSITTTAHEVGSITFDNFIFNQQNGLNQFLYLIGYVTNPAPTQNLKDIKIYNFNMVDVIKNRVDSGFAYFRPFQIEQIVDLDSFDTNVRWNQNYTNYYIQSFVSTDAIVNSITEAGTKFTLNTFGKNHSVKVLAMPSGSVNFILPNGYTFGENESANAVFMTAKNKAFQLDYIVEDKKVYVFTNETFEYQTI